MRIQVLCVNHGTTPYADLLLRSLIAHHDDRSRIGVLVSTFRSPRMARSCAPP